MGKSLVRAGSGRDDPAVAGVMVVGPVSAFCCSDADAGGMAVADEDWRTGGGSVVCAGASWLGSLEEGKPLADATGALLGAEPMLGVVVFFSPAGGTLSASFLAEEAVRLFPVPVTGVLCV